MLTSRRGVLLAMLAGTVRTALVGAGAALNGSSPNPARRRYRASATVMLLNLAAFTRSGVGSGFITIDETERGLAIQFGAGSWPESARGLNRFGYIEERLVEDGGGRLAGCSYFAFMTTSAEKNTTQAVHAFEARGPAIPCVAAEGVARHGTFVTTVSRVELPSQITWRDYSQIDSRVRTAIASGLDSKRTEKPLPAGEAAPATFLYSVRRAMMSAGAHTSGALVFNGGDFLVNTEKTPEPARGPRIIRLNATIHDCASGVDTPFKVWYEAGSEHLPPLRFEYQAKSFLRLAFDYDAALTNGSGPEKESL